jgi:hypothetical protein
MQRCIFLSKNGQDPYIEMFAQGTGCVPVQEFDYDASWDPLVFRGILKHKLIKRCWADRRTFYYMDTGYFGNGKFKMWHRVVKNNLQHTEVLDRPADRFDRFGLKFANWNRSGRDILLVLPDEKPCKFYGIDRQQWITDTVTKLKLHTDRPIVLRERSANRQDRMITDPLQQVLKKNVFAVVTYNSVAAVESVFAGIPVFTLAPVNAASPMACQDISKIETPFYPDSDQLRQWASHLAYGQFHVSELKSGSVWKILDAH